MGNLFEKAFAMLLAKRTVGELLAIVVVCLGTIYGTYYAMAATNTGWATVEAVQSNGESIDAVATQVNSSAEKLDIMYLRSIVQAIYEQTRQMCTLPMGSPFRIRVQQDIDQLYKEYKNANEGQPYRKITCAELGLAT